MFEIVNNRQVIFGENKISEIPGLLKWYGCRKVFFAAYSSSADSYIRIARALTEAGIEHVCYDKVAGEPDLHMINGGRDISWTSTVTAPWLLEAAALLTRPRPSACWP